MTCVRGHFQKFSSILPFGDRTKPFSVSGLFATLGVLGMQISSSGAFLPSSGSYVTYKCALPLGQSSGTEPSEGRRAQPEGMGVCRQNPELEVHLVNKTPLVSLGHMPALVCLGNRPPLEEEGTDP